jgi:small multidrug resistance pump
MESKNWMKTVMRVAAVYNLMWGAWVVLFPLSFFKLTGMAEPVHPMIWQGMGMVIGVYGLGYWWAAHNPVKHWPIIAVGFLGKIFGPLGFAINYLNGAVPFSFGYTLITNDFIWWVPFVLILNEARNKNWQL